MPTILLAHMVVQHALGKHPVTFHVLIYLCSLATCTPSLWSTITWILAELFEMLGIFDTNFFVEFKYHIYIPKTPTMKSRTSKLKRVRFDEIVQCTLLDSDHFACGWEVWSIPELRQPAARVEPKISSLIAGSCVSQDDEFSLMARAASIPMSHASPSSPWSRAPSTPSSASQSTMFTSVHVFDLQRNQAHGRVRAEPDEAHFIDVRRLLGYTQHDVAAQFHIVPPPADLDAAHILPILLLRHDDLTYGNTDRAVLVYTELHGDRFDTIIETDRYTTMVPPTITRAYILRITGVSVYCRMHHHRCLVWVRGRLIGLQSQEAIQIQHGDYIRVAVPPFEEPSLVPTHFAVKGCQAGLGKDEIVNKFQQGAHSDSLDSDINAMLTDSPAVDPAASDPDHAALLQTSFQPFPAFDIQKLEHVFLQKLMHLSSMSKLKDFNNMDNLFEVWQKFPCSPGLAPFCMRSMIMLPLNAKKKDQLPTSTPGFCKAIVPAYLKNLDLFDLTSSVRCGVLILLIRGETAST